METRVSAAGMTWTFDAITWPAESYFLLENLRGTSRRQSPGGLFFRRGLPAGGRFLRRGFFRRRHLAARASRFGQSDRDRLFAAGNLLAGTAALQRARLELLHYLLDFLRRLLAVFARCFYRQA